MGLATAGAAGALAQDNRSRAFGPGNCGPVDPSYVRVTNATGGQVLPLGPTEVSGSASLIAASSGTETVYWATSTLSASGQTITLPVDALTPRVAFIASTVGALTDMAVTDPRGNIAGAGTAGVEAATFACVRSVTIDRPVSGAWTIRLAGSGSFWLVVHAKSELALDDAEFVRVGGRPGHEGLFRIDGQPMAGRPATLRARITREHVSDAAFDLVSMSGASLQSVGLAPVSPGSIEDEYVGEIANLPAVPFRVRVIGRDRTGAAYQRMSAGAFHAATVEIIAPDGVELRGGQPVHVTVSNAGAPARFQIVAVATAKVLRVEPASVEIGRNETRDVTIWAEVPADARNAPDIIITAESPADPAASNSAILRAR